METDEAANPTGSETDSGEIDDRPESQRDLDMNLNRELDDEQNSPTMEISVSREAKLLPNQAKMVLKPVKILEAADEDLAGSSSLSDGIIQQPFDDDSQFSRDTSPPDDNSRDEFIPERIETDGENFYEVFREF